MRHVASGIVAKFEIRQPGCIFIFGEKKKHVENEEQVEEARRTIVLHQKAAAAQEAKFTMITSQYLGVSATSEKH